MTVETAETKPLSIGDIRSSLESGARNAAAITEACFHQIEARDPEIHAYLPPIASERSNMQPVSTVLPPKVNRSLSLQAFPWH